MRGRTLFGAVAAIGVLVCSALRGQQFPDGDNGELYYAPRIDLVGLTIDLDGELDEEAWQRASFQGANGTAETAPEGPDDIGFRWAAVADEEFLYVAVEVTDDIPQAGNDFHAICDVWQDDSFEIYIDANNDGPDCATADANCYGADDAQYTVGRENAGLEDPALLLMGGLAGGATCDFGEPTPELCLGVVVETDDGWRAEIAVVLEVEGNLDFLGDPDGTPTWTINPDHGCRIGWNIQVNDDDVGGGRDTKALWALSEVAGGESAWRNPGVFGKLVFIDPTQSLPRDPVSNLTCTRNPDGTLGMTWENPTEGEPADTIRILVDGVEVTTVPGTDTSATLTEEQVPDDGRDHTIAVDNGTCTPATCLVRQSGFDNCAGIRFWNLLGAYGPAAVNAGDETLRQDYMTDGLVTEDDFIWLPGQTINTAFGAGAASTTYDDGLGSIVPTVQPFEGDSSYVDLQVIFNNQENVMAYAQCYVINQSDSEMEVWWADSSDDSIQVKLNGREVWIHDEGRGAPNSCQALGFPQDVSPDGALFLDPLVLEPGENNLVVKVFNGCCGWNFIGRFQDADGNPVTEDLKISLFPSGADLPVLNLTCERQEDGTVIATWANPESADPAVPIRFEVDGAELATTVPGDATTVTLTEADVPRDGRDHLVTVINSSDIGATCRVARDTAFAPPELQDVGGELRINAGGPDVVDAAGRTWQADPIFLTPGQVGTNTALAAGIVDITLLEDPDTPNEMLLSERWCDCTIHYQMKVPDDDYSVILYFAETCDGCVNASLGGTNADPSAARVFDIEVEEERVEAYDQADAALPPEDDGAGIVFAATQVEFDVTVEDGLLDIRIVDRGGGNPPENSSLKGISVERVGRVRGLFRRGDSNADGQLNITDGVFLFGFLFTGGAPPPCRDAADTSDQGLINITSGIYILNFLFLGGPRPPAPFEACGQDGTQEDPDLGCESFPPCL